MRTVPPALPFAIAAMLLVSALLVTAVAWPQAALAVLPAAVALLLAMLFYEAPLLAVLLLAGSYGLALDVQLELLAGGGGSAGAVGSAVVKTIPFGVAAMLCLRYGVARGINWPFLAFALMAVASLVVLPIGRVSTPAEMVRSFIGSAAPFVLAFAAAPRSLWSALCKAVVAVPLISAAGGLLTGLVGVYPAFDLNWRFQGLHSPPFLAGFCTTAIFAATLEYLRGFRTRWLVLGGAALAVLLATQARAPLIVVALFLLMVVLLSDRHTFPLKRKVDLAMGGLLPALLLLGPLLVFAADRLLGGGDVNLSGRDVIWPYFVEAIERRPVFGYGLGAGKLIVDPEDPQIRLIRSNAAHNEYLRLAVDGGIVGAGLVFGAIIAWVWGGTRRAAPADRLVLRCALLGALIHAAFDNTLIATTSVIQYGWFAAALARARLERREAGPGGALRDALRGRSA